MSTIKKISRIRIVGPIVQMYTDLYKALEKDN